jgi:hypothetical protein
MGYAGICSPNVQANSDAMFHYISIAEISNSFANNGTASCAENINISNTAPVIQPTTDYNIPKDTPFMLEADATDINGDILTYSWEQLDNEVAPMPPQSSSTGGPSFRTFLPSTNPIRYFPQINTLLSGNYATTWEVLPNVERTLNFGVIVRDNNILGGQIAEETTTLSVQNAGPFRVTSQSTSGINWTGNTFETVTWDVANTDDPTGVNAVNVDILLSTDGGLTYNLALITNTPNDGSEQIPVPNLNVSSARIMVKGSGNVFFDLNTENFSIFEGVDCTSVAIPANLQANTITTSTANINWDPQLGAEYDLQYREVGMTSWFIIEDLIVSNSDLTGLSPSTEYEVQVRSKCPNDTPTAYSPSLFFTTEDIILDYCDSQGNIQEDEYISRVDFESIDNISADENGGYSDFTAISTQVFKEQDYPISITPFWTDQVFEEAYAVWIDFNQNGDFGDAGELVFTQSPTTSTIVSGIINIPLSALEGSTRMRVSMKYDEIPNPCETFQFGEVEDYTVVILDQNLNIEDNTFGADFSLYPNPTSNGQFSIKTPNVSGEVNVEIFNLLGQKVLSQKHIVEDQEVNVNAEGFSTGIYVVKLSQGSQSFISKLIIK